MDAKIVRTDEEIKRVMARCMRADTNSETAYPAMSYEQGILAVLRWLTDKREDYPFDSDDDE